MSPLGAFAIEVSAVIVVYVLTNFAILALRNPQRGALLKTSLVADLLTALVILATFIAQAFLGAGVFGIISNVFVAMVVFAGLVLGLYFIVSYLMGMDRRLAACDAGFSPFKSPIPPLGGVQPQG